MNPTKQNDPVISITGLSRHFGLKPALDSVNLSIARGKVFGLVGENGAGKTTLIKHILGLFRAETGSVRVFGQDPVKEPVSVLGRIGYLSENRDLPPWMRIHELLRYMRSFYPAWDDAYAEQLRGDFNLDPNAKVKNLSRGESAKAALLVALAYRPELLVLDEPSSGLDPMIRRNILEAIVRTVADEGRTVFFSSHLLDEVERVCDEVAIMFDGQVALSGPLNDIKAGHRHFLLRFGAALPSPPALDGALDIAGQGREWSVVCNGDRPRVLAAVERLGGEVLEERFPSLDEIFVAQRHSRSLRAAHSAKP